MTQGLQNFGEKKSDLISALYLFTLLTYTLCSA
jgi:hypothetical protein